MITQPHYLNKNSLWVQLKKPPLALVLGLVCLLLLLFPPAASMHLRINYADTDYSDGETFKVLTSYRDDTIPFSGLQNTYARTGESRIYFLDFSYRKGNYVRRLDPADTDRIPMMQIRSIELWCSGFLGGILEGQALYDAFIPNEQVEKFLNEEGCLELLINGNDSQLFPTEVFRQLYSDTASRYARFGVFYLLLFAAAVFGLSRIYGKLRKSRRAERYLDVTDVLLWLTAIGVVCILIIAVFTGNHRDNPDEWESRDAIRYYMDHNFPPDIRDPEALPTVGTYGTTRLSEFNPYYFYAGKLAALISCVHNERLFGLCLGIGLFLFCLLHARKNRYLLAACFLTPQLWYLYAYTTSDALDYLVSVIVLYQLANPESMLNRLTARQVKKEDILRILLLGTMFAHVMMAKANFYVILIYAFLMLLVPLLQAKGPERKQRFLACLWILLASLFIFGIRLGFEFAHYGLQRNDVILEVQNALGAYELRPSTPPQEQAPEFAMYNKGVSFLDFMTKYGFHKQLFQSTVGVYGGMDVYAQDWYYKAMALLYFLLYMGISVPLWWKPTGKRKGSHWKTEDKALGQKRISWGLLHIPVFVSYLLVVYNGFFVDYQPQGRYILPIFVMAAHAVSLDEHTVKSKWFNLLLVVTALLSLYSFAIGVPQLREV